MNKNLAIIIITILVLLVAGAGLYWYSSTPMQANSSSYKSIEDLRNQTAQENPAFSAGLQAENAGNFQSAVVQLRNALTSAGDASQLVAIQFHLADDYARTGDYTDAVLLFEQVAATSNNPPITRAYATESLGSMYQRYPNPSITQAIFAAAPYASLNVATSTNLTYRHLFEYAATIYPLPVSEYYIANAYANSIIGLNLPGSNVAADKAKLASLEQKLENSFKAGDAGMPTVTQNPPSSSYVLTARLVRAIVLGKMQQIGDTKLGDAGTAFEALLTTYAGQNLANDGPVRLQYAYFLVNVYGTSRASDIQTLLAPVVQDPTNRAPGTQTFVKSLIGAPATIQKQNLAKIAAVDAQFKTFLTSLGWSTADFAAATGSGAGE